MKNPKAFLEHLIKGYNLELEIRGNPKVILYGKKQHYVYDSIELNLIKGLNVGVVLHEDLVDSVFLGKENKFEHGDFYSVASPFKKQDIEIRVDAISIAKKKGFNIIGPDVFYSKYRGKGFLHFLTKILDSLFFWKEDIDRREVHFVNMIKNNLNVSGVVVVVLGEFHVRSSSYVSKWLKKSKLDYAVIRLKEKNN
ncbi:hypothetical protein HN840_01775 [archaeon]|nr:hypothetical protein [archaeon]MBT5288041.1 hypothetical protein [archaeon]MBT7281039.1 hypothetical protein [archaeon]